MKKSFLFLLLLLSVTLVCTASCGGSTETPTETSSESATGSESESESESLPAEKTYRVEAVDEDGFAFPSLAVIWQSAEGEISRGETDDDGVATLVTSLEGVCVSFEAPEGYAADPMEYAFDGEAKVRVTVSFVGTAEKLYSVAARDLMGAAVAGVSVRILNADGETVAEGVTGEDGNFSVSLPVSTYTCTVLSPDAEKWLYMGAAEIPFGDSGTASASFVKVEKAEEKEYTVRVLDTAEAPIAGIAVMLVNESGETVAEGVTDASGVYRVTLPIGDYTAKITMPADASGETELSLGSAGGAEFVLQTGLVAKEESHYIYVKNHEGKALKGVTVRVVSDGETLFEGTTNATGRVRVTFTAVNFYIVAEGAAGYNSGLCFEFDEDGTGTIYLDPQPNGSEQFPFQLDETPYTTATVAAGDIVYYHVRYPGDKGVTMPDGGVIWYNGSKKTLTAGEYFAFTESPLSESITLGISTADGKAGEVSFRVSGPLGSMDNPIPLELGATVTVTVEKNGAVVYSYVAERDGILVYTSEDPLNSSAFSNITSSFYGGSTNGARITTMYVRAGDEVILTASTVYNEKSGFSPAGSYAFTLTQVEGSAADPAPFDSKEADIFIGTDATVVYVVAGGAGKTLTFENSPALVAVADGVTYTADANGTVTVTLGADGTVTLQNGAGYGKIYYAVLSE